MSGKRSDAVMTAPECLEDQETKTMDGIGIIAAERARHVTQEGWTSEHDDRHDQGELAQAAAAYAMWGMCGYGLRVDAPWDWPWDSRWWKPTTPIRDLAKAGSLIAAEIDRRLRAGDEELAAPPEGRPDGIEGGT